jgi:hypothetical protein
MKRMMTLLLAIGLFFSLFTAKSASGHQIRSNFERNLIALTSEANRESQKVFERLGRYDSPSSTSYSTAQSASWTVQSPVGTGEPVRIRNHFGEFSVYINQKITYNRSYDLSQGPRAYEFADGSSIAPIVKADGSVQIVSQIGSAGGSHRFEYQIELPKGMELNQELTSGSIYIKNSNDEFIGGIAPAWATDANGQSVNTWYELVDNRVIQVIDKSQSKIKYPVIADPWLGFDLISRTSWVALTNPPNRYAPTIAVYPSDWGRTVAGATTFPFGGALLTVLDSLSVRAAWDETLSKTIRSGHPNPNTSSVYHQFECHFFYVSKRAPNKPSWNLDLNRRDASLLDQALNDCNIP